MKNNIDAALAEKIALRNGGSRKLTPQQVEQMIAAYCEPGATFRSVGAAYGVSATTVMRQVRKRARAAARSARRRAT